jgi:hypothetical protein
MISVGTSNFLRSSVESVMGYAGRGTWLLPSAVMTKSCGVPVRVEVKRRRRPLGDKEGSSYHAGKPWAAC